jgi:hypothetical protein
MMHPPTQTNDPLYDLPLVLAGPLLQHTEPTSVTVWIALQAACQVELKVYATQADQILEEVLLVGQRQTVALGEALHVVAVTARSDSGFRLSSDRIYAYDLQFTPSNAVPQTLNQALCSPAFPTVEISYFAHGKPTFALPPDRLEDLQLAHGSCRKPHGRGFDALPILDSMIAEFAHLPRHRPHQLFLTGDQIYGDDVAEPILWAASRLGDRLLGWEEQLPIGEKDKLHYVTPRDLAPGDRATITTQKGGFTAGLNNKSEKVNSHLLGLGEYYASYLLAWSPVCWTHTLPSESSSMNRRWNGEVRQMKQFVHTLWKVRRALANVPMYTIFDDHDVSDDWNLNQAWCLRVLGRSLGQRVVQNAMLAYAVFQAWGNTPTQFEPDQVGGKLLTAAANWSASKGTDDRAKQAIGQYLGLPPTDPQTGMPRFVRDGAVLILDRHPESLTWNFTVHSHCHEVIVLDTRTWRGYPTDAKATAPPMLLCPQAFQKQLALPLKEIAESSHKATFVIAPTNLFGLKIIDYIHHWHLRRNKVFSTDVGDSWNINTEALAQLLLTLFRHRERIVVLSGDIHYGSAIRLTHSAIGSPSESVLVQLTASSVKNEEILTEVLHTRLKHWLLPEKKRQWIGWDQPMDMLEYEGKRNQDWRAAAQIPQGSIKATHKGDTASAPPDWYCALDWIPRESFQPVVFRHHLSWLMPSWKKARLSKWWRSLMIWRNLWFNDGREVVGRNNLAFVHFEGEDGSHIAQDLYWFSTDLPIRIVYSRFQTRLTPDEVTLMPPCQNNASDPVAITTDSTRQTIQSNRP